VNLLGHRLSVSAVVGLSITAINIAAVALAPWIAPYGQAELVGDVWAAPSAQSWLGLDNLGRDILSRLLFGGRTSVTLALLITVLSFVIGIFLGFAAATTRRWVDIALSRMVDTLMAIPSLIMALVVLSVLGTSLPVLVGTIAVLEATRVFRVSRSVAMNIVVLDYVEAARLRGEGLWWVMRREVLPNALPPLIAEFGLRFCFSLLFVASLSFLGLGVQPPEADWGSMVHDNATAINFGGIAPLLPAAAIALLTIGVNLVVDWLLSIHGRAHGEGT
jgi:peptide/nickel transport system permease protein